MVANTFENTICFVDNPPPLKLRRAGPAQLVDKSNTLCYTLTTNTELTAAPDGRSRFYFKTPYEKLTNQLTN